MDEPFASLDIGLRRELHQELLDLWERGHQTILFVTHDVEEALYLSDRIHLLSPRPTSIVGTIEVSFERPRRSSLFTETAFLQLKARTVDMLLSIANGEKSLKNLEL
jgi:NitT/TauT family transport system ATP-binding protein